MPYLQREWSKYLGYGAPTPTYKLRTIPLVESVDLMAQGISAEHALGKEPSSDPPKADCVDRFFVIQLRNELTKQVREYVKRMYILLIAFLRRQRSFSPPSVLNRWLDLQSGAILS